MSDEHFKLTMEAMQAAFDKAMSAPRRKPMRIVSYERYQEAKKAIDAGATPWQIEMCLAGASWELVKEQTRD